MNRRVGNHVSRNCPAFKWDCHDDPYNTPTAPRPACTCDPRVTARTNNPDTTAPIECECGDTWPCESCGACVTCGPERARCDVVHCDDPWCCHDCPMCVREMRP